MRAAILSVAVLLGVSQAALAAKPATVSCGARNAKTQDYLANFDLKFQFAETAQRDTLTQLTGSYAISSYGETNSGSWQPDYKGAFAVARVDNDPKYRPRKYKDCVKFPLTSTDSDAWVSFIFPKTLKGAGASFKAYAVMQAGDHFGGTVVLHCTAR